MRAPAPRTVLVRALPATAIALVATSVSAGALERLAGAGSGGDVVRGIVLLANAALWWGFATITVFRAVPARRGPWRHGAVLVALAALGAVMVTPAGAGGAGPVQVAASGLISLASIGMAMSALGRLGRCFGVLPDARGLVTRGPYRVVRHPIYLGELGALAGVLVVAPSARNALAMGVMTVAQLGRARLEERTLASAFPEYVAYAARTPMLIPRFPGGA